MNTQDIKDAVLVAGPILSSFITWLLTRRQKEVESIAVLNSAITNLAREVISLRTENIKLRVEVNDLHLIIKKLKEKYGSNEPTDKRERRP